MASPLAVFPLGAITAIIYYTAKDRSNGFALQADGRNREAVERCADSRCPRLWQRHRPGHHATGYRDRAGRSVSFIVRIHQIGKTQEQLEKACAQFPNALSVASVGIVRTVPSEYAGTYSPEDPIEVIAAISVPYA